jgi:hypothetical protein
LEYSEHFLACSAAIFAHEDGDNLQNYQEHIWSRFFCRLTWFIHLYINSHYNVLTLSSLAPFKNNIWLKLQCIEKDESRKISIIASNMIWQESDLNFFRLFRFFKKTDFIFISKIL